MPDAIAASVGSGQVIDALQYDFSQGQVVAVGAAAASSSAFLYAYTAATITSTTNCWYSIGATAVAHGAASEYLPAGLKLKVKFAAGQTISVIQDTAAGYLSIAPASTTNMGPLLLDTVPGVGGAYSLRRLASSYLGPAVNIRRSSDNATQDVGFVGNDFDFDGFNAFVGGGSGFVTKWYDQSGNGNHTVPGPVTSQPQLVSAVAALNGRAALLYTQTQPQVLGIPNSPTVNMPFLNGGYIAAVVNLQQTPTGQIYFWQTQGNGNENFGINTAPALTFAQAASGGNGAWVTSGALALGSHQIDVQYSAAALSNVPTMFFDGGAQTNGYILQPVGTILSENGSLIGGNGATCWPGYIAEFLIYKSQPAPGPIRANQKAYWGTP